MTDTVLIGSSCALGAFWSSKRYFDYLIDETNLSLLRGKEFGQAVIICPSLREVGTAILRNTAPFLAQVKTLIYLLHDVKAERVTYITSIDTQPETGNELSPLLREQEDEWLAALVELKNFINLRFGRVLTVYLPEVTGTGAGMSVADLLAEAGLELNKTQAAEAVNVMLDAFTNTLKDGGTVDMFGFGKFTVTERAARSGINPATREKIEIAATKAVKFKPAKALKDALQ